MNEDLERIYKAVSSKNITPVDPVTSPSHYNQSIECWDAMEAMMAGNEPKVHITPYASFLWGNIFKYLWRWPYKSSAVEDLKKARVYLNRLIDRLEENDQAR